MRLLRGLYFWDVSRLQMFGQFMCPRFTLNIALTLPKVDPSGPTFEIDVTAFNPNACIPKPKIKTGSASGEAR